MLTPEDLEAIRLIVAAALDSRGITTALPSDPAREVRGRKKSFALPEWLAPERDVWDAWVEARTRAKHPPTDWAKWLAVAKLEALRDEGHNVRGLLAEAAFHNWSSFYVRDKK